MRLLPGLSFSGRRAFGISALLGRFARTTGRGAGEDWTRRQREAEAAHALAS